MNIIDFSLQHSVINTYMSELRDSNYQKSPLLFRNNIRRIGQFIAYEISNQLDYHDINVMTPLGNAAIAVPTDKIVVAIDHRDSTDMILAHHIQSIVHC